MKNLYFCKFYIFIYIIYTRTVVCVVPWYSNEHRGEPRCGGILADVFAKCRSRALELREVYPPSDDTLLMIERAEEQLCQLLSRGEESSAESSASVVRTEVNVL